MLHLCAHSRHLVTEALSKSLSTATTSTPGTASPLASTSSLLSLFTPLFALSAIRTVAPATSATKLEIKCLLALLNHRVDLLGDGLGKRLCTRELNAVEDDNPGGLVE